MADFQNLDNYPLNQVEPTMIIDEVSASEFYIGTSVQGNITANAVWKIKRIWKIGNLWYVGYPTGDQRFNYIWDDRVGYAYA